MRKRGKLADVSEGEGVGDEPNLYCISFDTLWDYKTPRHQVLTKEGDMWYDMVYVSLKLTV
jgi:hypothetical protein